MGMVRGVVLLLLLALTGWAGKIHTSTDGTSWVSSEIDHAKGDNLVDITYGNGKYIAVGANGTILVSTDLQTWSDYSVSDSLLLYSVTYGDGIYVISASEEIFQSNDTATYAYYSSDGASWTKVTLPMLDWMGKVSFENGKFYIVGSNGVLSSSNGADWTTHYDLGNLLLNDIAYGRNLYIACGFFGKILKSNDSSSWTDETDSQAYLFRDILFYNNTFLMLDGFGSIFTSSDGTSWTSNKVSGVGTLEDSAGDTGGFVISTGNGYILYSSDASSWQSVVVDSGKVIGSVLSDGNQFVALQSAAVSTDGSIVIPDSSATQTVAQNTEINVTLLEDGAYSFNLSDLNQTDVNVSTLQSIKLISHDSNGTLYYKSESYTLGSDINTSDMKYLIYTPKRDEYGVSYGSVVLQEDNGSGYSDINYTVRFSVTAVNDPVELEGSSSSVTLDVNQSGSVTFAYSDPDTDSSNIFWSYATSDSSLFPLANISLSDDGDDKVLSFTPVSDTNGSASLYLTANDGALDTVAVVSVTVRGIVGTEDVNESNSTFAITAYEGWNLLSLPVYDSASDDELDVLFGGQQVVKLYKYSDAPGLWLVWCNSYFPEQCYYQIKFATLDSVEGFWLKANQDFTLNFTYTPEQIVLSDAQYSNEVPTVLAPWTLGGINRDMEAQELVGLINQKSVNMNNNRQVKAILHYDSQKKSWRFYSPQPELSQKFSGLYESLESLKRHEAFWIWSEEK